MLGGEGCNDRSEVEAISLKDLHTSIDGGRLATSSAAGQHWRQRGTSDEEAAALKKGRRDGIATLGGYEVTFWPSENKSSRGSLIRCTSAV